MAKEENIIIEMIDVYKSFGLMKFTRG